MMMLRLFLTLVFLFPLQVIAEQGWLCEEVATMREGDDIYSCGVGEGETEAMARADALARAEEEFKNICQLSGECQNKNRKVEPLRTDCRETKNGYKCFRGLRYQLVGGFTQQIDYASDLGKRGFINLSTPFENDAFELEFGQRYSNSTYFSLGLFQKSIENPVDIAEGKIKALQFEVKTGYYHEFHLGKYSIAPFGSIGGGLVTLAKDPWTENRDGENSSTRKWSAVGNLGILLKDKQNGWGTKIAYRYNSQSFLKNSILLGIELDFDPIL